jgi:hypothetical protein
MKKLLINKTKLLRCSRHVEEQVAILMLEYLEVASEMVEFEEDKEVPAPLREQAQSIAHKMQDLRMDHHQLWL